MDSNDKQRLFEKRPYLKDMPENLEFKARRRTWENLSNRELVKMYIDDRPEYDRLLKEFTERKYSK